MYTQPQQDAICAFCHEAVPGGATHRVNGATLPDLTNRVTVYLDTDDAGADQRRLPQVHARRRGHRRRPDGRQRRPGLQLRDPLLREPRLPQPPGHPRGGEQLGRPRHPELHGLPPERGRHRRPRHAHGGRPEGLRLQRVPRQTTAPTRAGTAGADAPRQRRRPDVVRERREPRGHPRRRARRLLRQERRRRQQQHLPAGHRPRLRLPRRQLHQGLPQRLLPRRRQPARVGRGPTRRRSGATRRPATAAPATTPTSRTRRRPRASPVNQHPTHAAAAYGPRTACGDCHAASTPATATHVNGSISFDDGNQVLRGTIGADATVTSCDACHAGSAAAAKG